MKISFRSFQDKDFNRIREFLIKTFEKQIKGLNWRLDRWNFAFSMSRIMNFTTIQELNDQIGIWENEQNEIVAVVNSEGEGKGEVFFQIGLERLPKEIIGNMFVFAENKLLPKDSQNTTLRIWISDRSVQFENIASERGYKKLDCSDITSSIKISDWVHSEIPKGYFIRSGNRVSDIEKGKAHALAFGYSESESSKISPFGYELMRQMPDYNPDLDLYILNESNQIVSFCTMWHDSYNKFGALEPVGTHPDYRRKGLGYAVISEAIKRIGVLGAENVYVGSDQDFYLSIGFSREFKSYAWQKTII